MFWRKAYKSILIVTAIPEKLAKDEIHNHLLTILWVVINQSYQPDPAALNDAGTVLKKLVLGDYEAKNQDKAYKTS